MRPQDWPAIAVTAPGKLVVSVMAGVTLADIAARLGTDRVVRALPNAAAEVGQSYTPWTATAQVTDADRATVRRLLDSFGTGDEVATEAEIDYMTGLSGTGPAYPALLAVALMRDAVAHGLPPEVARRSVTALLVGTGRLLEKNGENPEDTVAAFVDYRGVTAAAIEAMRAAGFDAAVSAGLSAALEKSLALQSLSQGDTDAARCNPPVLHRRGPRGLRARSRRAPRRAPRSSGSPTPSRRRRRGGSGRAAGCRSASISTPRWP